MLLASGHWYTSGAFWAPASGVLAVIVIGVLGYWVVWRSANPKKQLVYSVSEPTPLVASEPLGSAGTGLLSVSYDEMPLTNPYVVTLEVSSRSRRDIRSSDFDGDRPLTFSLDADVKAVLDLKTRSGPLHVLTRSVELSPSLIRRGKVFKVSLLTEGAPTITPRSQLADVSVVQRDDSMAWTFTLSGTRGAGAAIIGSWLFASIWTGWRLVSNRKSVPQLIGIFASFAALPLFIRWVVIPFGNWARARLVRKAEAGLESTSMRGKLVVPDQASDEGTSPEPE